YVRQYWNKWGSGVDVARDGAKRAKEGDFWLLRSVVDVINVGRHRLGTLEGERALTDYACAPRGAVGGAARRSPRHAPPVVADSVTHKVCAQSDRATNDLKALVDDLKEHVVKKIGAIARPDDILFAADLPKTRSGKIMRRLLRDIAEGKALGDTTTLADPAV